tara:strand:+ start:475 stop:741 length:267 start_codon:yes stop_codon:yes gene_type:complete
MIAGSDIKGFLYGILLHYFISLFTINKSDNLNFLAPFGIGAGTGTPYKLKKKLLWKNIGDHDLDVVIPEDNNIKVYKNKDERKADENF